MPKKKKEKELKELKELTPKNRLIIFLYGSLFFLIISVIIFSIIFYFAYFFEIAFLKLSFKIVISLLGLLTYYILLTEFIKHIAYE